MAQEFRILLNKSTTWVVWVIIAYI